MRRAGIGKLAYTEQAEQNGAETHSPIHICCWVVFGCVLNKLNERKQLQGDIYIYDKRFTPISQTHKNEIFPTTVTKNCTPRNKQKNNK